jgi:hypothetical protein
MNPYATEADRRLQEEAYVHQYEDGNKKLVCYRAKALREQKDPERYLLITFGSRGMKVPQDKIHEDSEVYEAAHEGKLVVDYRWTRKQNWWTEDDE